MNERLMYYTVQINTPDKEEKRYFSNYDSAVSFSKRKQQEFVAYQNKPYPSISVFKILTKPFNAQKLVVLALNQTKISDEITQIFSNVNGTLKLLKKEEILIKEKSVQSVGSQIKRLNSLYKIHNLQTALKEAKAHVFRQQFAGKHEQDRIDATEWIEKYGTAI